MLTKWNAEMSQSCFSYVSKTSVSCGVTLIVLHVIAWPSLAVWIAIDAVLVALLILQQLIKKPPEPLIVIPVKGNNNKRGGFVDAMSELTRKKQSGGRGGTSTHSNSRQVKKYSHDYSRYTPDDRYIKTPRPATAVVRNRLSYSAAESSFGTSFGLRSTTTTPNCFSPISTTATTNMVQGGSALSFSPWHHGHTPRDVKTSSVLRIARSNLPATMDVHSPIMTSPAREVVEAKSQSNTPSKDAVVNALKQISHKRKRVHPLSDDKEDSEFLDSLPSVKRIRQEPRHQAIKRTWTKVINTESINQPSMPDTKKHKKTVNVVEKEKTPTSTPEIVVANKEIKQLETETDEEKLNNSIEPVKPTEELELNTSDKENVSIDLQSEQEKIKQLGVLKKMRTIYPSSKPSVDALRRKFPVLCSSGVAPKLGRQSSQVKYEDYVKDREDVYAKVKRVLEEEENDEVKKKKEDTTTVSTSSSVPSTSGAVASIAPPNVSVSLAAQTVPSNIIIPTATVTSAGTAPPSNLVISSIVQVTSTSTSTIQSSAVLSNLALFTSKPDEAAPSSTVLSSVLPTVISLNSTANVTSASQKFSFSLLTAQPQSSTSSIQQSSISLPLITTTSSSNVGPSPLLPPFSTNTSNTVLPQFDFLAKTPASQVGPSLQQPPTSTSTSSTIQPQFNFLAKTTANSNLQLPSTSTSTSSTIQSQFNFLAKSTSSLVGTNNFCAKGATLGLTSSTTSSSTLPSTSKLLTTANTNAKSSGIDADGGMEIAAPQANTSFSNLFNNTNKMAASAINTTNGNFAGLFSATASVAPTINSIATSSSVASNFGNLFGQSTTTTISTSSHAFTFNLNQSSQTTKPLQLGNQLQQNPSKTVPTFNFGLPVSAAGAAQSSQPTINFGLPTSGSNLVTNQPQTQAGTGFNFIANANTSTAGFSFNLQPSLCNTGNVFSAPPGGLNLPPTPAQPARRKPKTPSRNKTRRK